MNLSDLIDERMLRKLALMEVNSIVDEMEDLEIRMKRLKPMADTLMQTSFESYTTEKEITQAISVSLTTLALIDACIEDFTGKAPERMVRRIKRKKKVGKHVN